MSFLETRGLLAKLLATENLIITHDTSAKTASFDTESRELTLPVLNTECEHIYTLFAAHEVGHALHTPTNWRDIIPNNVPFDVVNVVEDVRIEKLIQNKFPGLRTDFSKGYDTLHNDDFFGIQDKDISKLSFIDRINLHAKLGVRALVPFTPEEQDYVDRVDQCESYNDVVSVAQAIAEFVNNKDETEPQPEVSNSGSSTGGEESEQVSQMKTDSDEFSDTSETSETSESSDGVDEESDQTPDQTPDETVSETQRNADESLKNLSTNYGPKYTYVNVPTEDLDFIVGIDELRSSYPEIEYPEFASFEKNRFNEYLTSIKRDVNFMVQQFEMKKSADAYSRTQTHKTGELDMNQLHSYKLTEDIFLRQSTTPDGKNHGMVMYLDWSGSMANLAHQTIKQILLLVQFCRKVQIPFEVYSFTTAGRSDEGREHYKSDYNNRVILRGLVQMVQILSSTAKRGDLETDMFHLWCESKCCVSHSPHMEMGGTPLDNAMFALPDIVKRFRENTKAQKVSVVLLTDGESSPVSMWKESTLTNGESIVRPSSTWHSNIMIRYGSHTYPIAGGRASSGSIAKWLSTYIDDVTITNIYLGSKAQCEHYIGHYGESLDTKTFDKERSVVLSTKIGWPLVTLINPKAFGDAQQEMEVEAGETKAKIRTALKKMLSSKSTSKLVLNALADQFS